MANSNRKRRTKKSAALNKESKASKKQFNKNSLAIFMMALSLFSFVFLVSNNTGSLGKIMTEIFAKNFGFLGYIIPLVLFVSFLFIYLDKYRENIKLFIMFYLIVLLTMAILAKPWLKSTLSSSLSSLNDASSFKGGGKLGIILGFYLYKTLGSVGVWLIYLAFCFAFLIGVSPLSYKEFFILVKDNTLKLGSFIGKGLDKLRDVISEKLNENDEILVDEEDSVHNEKMETLENQVKDESPNAKFFADDSFSEAKINEYKSKQVDLKEFDESFKKEYSDYNYPSIDLLVDKKSDHKVDSKDIKEKARKIEDTLKSFGLGGRVVEINVGPTVTSFELKPARGVKVSRILNLADDLSLALATSGIRIEAPIPGKSHVGIEVSNKHKEIVSFKEMITSDEYINSKYEIPFALGKTISGEAEVTGIEEMPHVLISGATGSGKSVCINTLIMSVLYKHSPEEVKLLMIDPKVVELSIYNGIPHLIMSVITDPKKASSSLYWAIREMERRYKLFEQTHVRDISAYRQMQEMDEDIEKLPYIIVIIDELSDLMMTAASEVEDYITRLAQKSRACGIHLVIATQRPTVDVITGTIKANIPTRIAFAVSSQVDSRTILDTSGAEKLLGKGDMLFAPSDAMKPTRIQGAFVSDGEVLSVVESIKEVNESEYNEDAIETVEEKAQVVDNPDEDELLPEAIKIVVNEQTASVSLLQRKLKVGYARAGRIVDQLEQRGLIGGYEGSKPRKVLVDRTYLEGE